jgi:hypothetical protein
MPFHAISCHFNVVSIQSNFRCVYVYIYIYTLYNYIIWLSVTSRSWFTPTVTDKTLPVGSSLTMTLCCFQNVRPASCGDYWSTLLQITATKLNWEFKTINHLQSPTPKCTRSCTFLHSHICSAGWLQDACKGKTWRQTKDVCDLLVCCTVFYWISHVQYYVVFIRTMDWSA